MCVGVDFARSPYDCTAGARTRRRFPLHQAHLPTGADGGPRWYVVRTHARREAGAETLFRRHGGGTSVPATSPTPRRLDSIPAASIFGSLVSGCGVGGVRPLGSVMPREGLGTAGRMDGASMQPPAVVGSGLGRVIRADVDRLSGLSARGGRWRSVSPRRARVGCSGRFFACRVLACRVGYAALGCPQGLGIEMGPAVLPV